MDEHLDQHERNERQYLEVELYEKILVRERRKKALLITLALTIFLFLCGIPVYNERLPKWKSLKAARKIAVQIEQMKTQSLHMKKPLKLTIIENGQLKIEQVSDCTSAAADVPGEKFREDSWTTESDEVSLLSEVDAKKLNLNLAVHQICFDPVQGVNVPKVKKVFVIVPVKDLAESRLDRASYVEVESATAKITIN